MSEESSPQMVLRFRNAETHRMLQRVAVALGVPMDELAEAAIRQGLAALAVNLEPNMQRTVELLGSFEDDPERNAVEFARAEGMYDDPLRARRAGPEDAYGIGAAFARHIDRG
jgi:hypothetical protein